MESFFFNDTATAEIYTLSLHDALPIYEPPLTTVSASRRPPPASDIARTEATYLASWASASSSGRSEEHTSELQSRQYLVCRLLLEKKITRISHQHKSLLHYHQYIHFRP